MSGQKYHSKDLRKYRHSEAGQVYLVTTCCMDRRPIFESIKLGEIVASEIMKSDNDGRSETFAFVVMPDHLHWLFQVRPKNSLASIVRLVKGMSAFRINQARDHNGSVWQPGFHDRTVGGGESLEALGNYVIANPVREGLVSTVNDYPLWDLMWQRMRLGIRG